jgi:hypothetical protein
MAKVSAPLMSLDASGQVGKAIVFSKWRGVNYVRRLVTPANPQSDDQTAIRDLVTDASKAWATGATVGGTTIDAAYKLAYKDAAAGQAYSGFNLYIRDCSALNNGVNYDGSLAIPTEPGDITP